MHTQKSDSMSHQIKVPISPWILCLIHTKANNPPSPTRLNVPTPGSPPRIMSTILLPTRQSEPEVQLKRVWEYVSLNSPIGQTTKPDMNPITPSRHYMLDVRDSYDATEEWEVHSLASPEKDECKESPLRIQGESYPSLDSGRPRIQLPFIMTRQQQPSEIGSQFIPPYRAYDAAMPRLDMLTNKISRLRKEMRSSMDRMENLSRQMNNKINRLINVLSQDRQSRSMLMYLTLLRVVDVRKTDLRGKEA